MRYSLFEQKRSGFFWVYLTIALGFWGGWADRIFFLRLEKWYFLGAIIRGTVSGDGVDFLIFYIFFTFVR